MKRRHQQSVGLAACLKKLQKESTGEELEADAADPGLEAVDGEAIAGEGAAESPVVADMDIDGLLLEIAPKTPKILVNPFKITEDQLSSLPEPVVFSSEGFAPREIQSIVKPFNPQFKMMFENNYVRSCKWSRSGKYLLTCSADHKSRIFTYQDGLLDENSIKEYGQGGIIYDQTWHPTMDLFATTSKAHPIKLFNADMEVVGVPRCVNHLDELDSAFSLAFTNDGSTLCAGFKNKLYVFDLISMRQQTKVIDTYTMKPRNKGARSAKSEMTGKKAWLSSIAMNPVSDGEFAVGTYNNVIGFYSDKTGELDMSFEVEERNVTQLKFSPDGTKLFYGSYMRDYVSCLDLRFAGTKMLLAQYPRKVDTGQRIYFDIDASGKHLFTGTTGGEILVYDLESMVSVVPEPVRIPTSARVTAGLGLHPSEAVFATSHGERVFPAPAVGGSDDEEEGTSAKDQVVLDYGLKLWSCT